MADSGNRDVEFKGRVVALVVVPRSVTLQAAAIVSNLLRRSQIVSRGPKIG